MKKCIIVAIADNNAIGKDNALLWHISEDLKFFRSTTVGCPVIMGRKTYESIGRPLPKRLNIIVSRKGYDAPEGVLVVDSIEKGYEVAKEQGAEKCFVIGGGQIYAQAMQIADEMIITHVHTVIEDADTYFPVIDPSIWQVAERSETHTDPETGYNFEFVTYTRK
ncbi:MAG: dihydrofolate reductase [Bacteroidales bacterium]|nr:dihydrofolate reductase [Bacteroidales bacterium]